MKIIRQIWDSWKKVGQFIGDFVARVILTIFYVTLFAPFGIGVRLLSDPLAAKRQPARWLAREQTEQNLDNARRLG